MFLNWSLLRFARLAILCQWWVFLNWVLKWLSFYRSSFLQKESSKKVVIKLEDSDLKKRFLSANLPTSPLSQQFVPTWWFSVNVGFGRGGGGLGGDCPVPEVSQQFFFVGKSSRFQTLGSNVMPKLSSVKYAIPGSPRYQQNRLNLLYSCSLHNRWYFFVIF